MTENEENPPKRHITPEIREQISAAMADMEVREADDPDASKGTFDLSPEMATWYIVYKTD